VLTALWFQRLKLKYDEALSNFAFKLNLRRYMKAADIGHLIEGREVHVRWVGRCRLNR